MVKCGDALSNLGDTLKVTIFWVPSHKNIEGNEQADGLTRRGSAFDNPPVGAVDVPLA